MSALTTFKTGRRDFIKTTGLATLGLLIGLDADAKPLNLSASTTIPGDIEINTFILISRDNSITIVIQDPVWGRAPSNPYRH